MTDPTGLLDAIAAVLERSGYRVRRPAVGSIEFQRGSQAKLRLAGGGFIAPTSLPVVGRVTCQPIAGGQVVDVDVMDDVGFGSRFGMKGKYEQVIGETSAEIVAVLRSWAAPSGRTRVCTCGLVAASDASFCTRCGNRI